MALIEKPDYTKIWASGGSVVEPSDTKKQTGWTAEVPPYQWENWIQNRQDQYLAHVNQRGVPEWDGNTEYEAGGLSYVQGSDGKVYKSVAASGPSSVVSNPTTDVTDTYWTVAFLTQTDGDSRYTQRANNLSDVTNVTTARTNLDVYSKVETDTRNLNSVRIDIASASNINLSTAAPNTRHINITGTTSINGFTAVAGVTYFVRFDGVLTLTNSASLVTQTGANIKTASGDTCIIRATAANVVEVMVYVDATVQSLAASGHRKFKDGLIIQWTPWSIAVVGSSPVSATVTLPIAFPNAHFITTGNKRDSSGDTASVFEYVGQAINSTSYGVTIVPNTTVNTTVSGFAISIGY